MIVRRGNLFSADNESIIIILFLLKSSFIFVKFTRSPRDYKGDISDIQLFLVYLLEKLKVDT